MAMPVFESYDTLRGELAPLLGFQAVTANTVLLNSFLRRAERELWEKFNWPYLIVVDTFTLLANQSTATFPSTAGKEVHPDRILPRDGDASGIRVDRTGSGDWCALRPGITSSMDRTITTEGYPQNFELEQPLRFWPTADVNYSLDVRGIRKLPDTFVSSALTRIDSDLVLMAAEVRGLHHYGKKNAQKRERDLAMRLAKFRGYEHGNRRYFRDGGSEPEMARPILLP